MTIYIALLRGINVGGHKVIKMIELKRIFEAMGFGRVQTYIQSGNVLFESEAESEPLRRRIEHEITAGFGFSVTVVLRTAVELERITASCPFLADELPAGESLYVSLLAEAPCQEGIDRLLACNCEIDEFRIVGREIYLLYRQSVVKSKLTNNLLERALGVPATTRNWRTMNTLADMGKAMAAPL
ncbi:MAG TPA: DUF1697 domain-containing protein [Symbiobacteriaceae bacterium]